MASDQMSVSSKKQQQLEAGKRRLEEFRKKKAAAKKAASSNASNGDLQQETKPPVADTVHVVKDENKEKKTIDVLEASTHANTVPKTNKPSETEVKLDHYAPQEEFKNNKFGVNVVNIEKSQPFHPSEEDTRSKSNHFINTRMEDPLRNSSYNGQPANGPTYRDSTSEFGKSLQGILEHRYPPATESSSSSLWAPSAEPEPEPLNGALSTSAGLAGRRSRPSFLDTINISRNSSSSVLNSDTDKEASNSFSSKIHPVDPPVSRNFINSSSVGDMFRLNEIDIDRNINYNSTKQNEDFAALEQHIEDLTQEKFSLQRALEASRVLAESLATENSALTDTYNQQGSVVNQLKMDMEMLQEEIKAQLAELEAMRTEYGNARLECNAADERSKLLASEVIGLEEKALRLRSNELKLERELENMEAEMSSQKRKIASLEKDRQELQFTIDALQEEKKLLQSKLRKAPPTIANSVDIKKSSIHKKEASTSTDDLVNESEDSTDVPSNLAVLGSIGESDASLQLQNRHFGFEVSSSSVPPDQIRMIQNINTLISELALEKEELVQALSVESSQSSKLKDLNKELTQKLEVQTQRLELLTSQSMVVGDNNININIPPRKSPPRNVVDSTPYADEGDEVVERVLGWIMKLFPGGPSRRQTKHL